MANGRGASKRRKPVGQEEEAKETPQQLLPQLPDHLSQLCLSLVPPPLLNAVCRSWRRLIYSASFPPFLSLYALLSSSISSSPSVAFSSFDPIAAAWNPLPAPPHLPHLLLRHASFLSRLLSVQCVSVSGHLVLLAATTHCLLPALPRPLLFHPISNQWRLGPRVASPRRWCAAGVVDGSVYVASGVGASYRVDVARSAQRWDLKSPAWEGVAQLKDGKFSREAVDAVGVRGKLCMVSMKGNVAKEGVVYDVRGDRWEDMPAGLLGGWTGPTAAMDEEVIYVADESSGALREYDAEGDGWKEVIRSSEELKGATQMAAGGGRVCAVVMGGTGIAVVDVTTRPARIWVVRPPPSTEVVSVHVLPRMSRAGQ
ncbi:hypothetical protein ACLOJK_041792 [Asimina triloba]